MVLSPAIATCDRTFCPRRSQTLATVSHFPNNHGLKKTEEFDTHLHAYVITTQSPIHITICKQSQLLDHHTLGLYKLCLYDDLVPTLYIVPKYVFANNM